MSRWNRPMTAYRPWDDTDWTGRWARDPGASALYAHTIRRRDKHGWRTWCGMRIERPWDEFVPGAVDCLGCRIKRDAS